MTQKRIAATLQLTRIATDKRRADYEFSEPVDALKFRQVADYRQLAWHAISATQVFVQEGQDEFFRSTKGSVKKFSIEVHSYDKFAPKNYAPNSLY